MLSLATASLFIVNPFGALSRAAGWFSTHPSTEERVQRLRDSGQTRVGLAGLDDGTVRDLHRRGERLQVGARERLVLRIVGRQRSQPALQLMGA